MRRRRRRSFSKERFLMVAASVLVLGSLTATGLWLRRDQGRQDEGYVVDLSAIENNTATGIAKDKDIDLSEKIKREPSMADDLDYDPYFQETNSQKVENPDQSESESMSDGANEARGKLKEDEKEESPSPSAPAESDGQAGESNEGQEGGEGTPALSTAMQPALTFSDSDTLVWPIVGNILVNYSMDKTVYFPTLQQYKYNPAIIIQANEGDLVTARGRSAVFLMILRSGMGSPWS